MIREVDRITICPFSSCESTIREDANQAVLAALGDNINLSQGANQQNMLEMYAHRYLPNEEVIEFIEKGVKSNGQIIERIENVLKPELVIAYERASERLRRSRNATEAQPHISYHGTQEARIESILERGLLVPGKGKGKDVTHATDTGFWGGGIYLSPNPGLSIGYMRGGSKLLMCSTLMGRRYQCTNMMNGADLMAGYDSHVAPGGQEWDSF